MARGPINRTTESSDYAMPPSMLDADGDGETIVRVDEEMLKADYLKELAFYEDPLEVVIHPSTHQHAQQFFELWNNGRGAEMLVNGRWEVRCWLPVNQPITVKRKIVEQMARARVVNITTGHDTAMVENPRNWLSRIPTAVHSFQIRHDPSPRGQEWLAMIMARDA